MQTLARSPQRWLWQGATLLIVLAALLLLSVTTVSAFPVRLAAAPSLSFRSVPSAPAAPATDWCSNITVPTTWTLAGSPYVVCPIYVNSGVTLTIEAGVVVKFTQSNGSITVDGALMARGTTGQPVIFTSYRDDSAGGDTNGDGAATAPAPGDWNWLHFNGASRGALEHVTVRYGGHDYGHNVQINTPNVTLTDSTFAYAREEGIYCEGAVPPLLARNQFVGNGAAAVWLAMNSASSLTLEGNQATGNAINGFVVNTAVNSNVTWDGDPALPFVVESLGVAPGAVFTLSPGDIFKSSGPHIGVAGTLLARGTAEAPIYFTSLRDDAIGGDTNGDGSATSPAPGDWNNLRFEYAAAVSGNVLEHVVVRYGGQGWHENIYVSGTDLTMRHATSSDAAGAGLALNGATVFVSDSTLTNNWTGVWVGGASSVIVTESRIAGNRDYGVQNASAPKFVDARYNWWGHATGPQHPTQNPSGQGNAVTDKVLFNPWFGQPGGSPVQRVVFQLLGPRTVTPGDAFDYIIDYYTSYAIDNAVLLFSLPYGSSFVAAAGGSYFGPGGQVYWQLGNLPAGAEGSVRVTAQSLWGLPAQFPDGAAVMMGGSNLQIAPYTIDTTAVVEHTPVQVTGSSKLDTDQINAALAASAPLKALHDQFIGQGYVRLGGVTLASSDSHQTVQLLLVHPQSKAVVDLRRDLTSNVAAAITFAGDVVTMTDANGAMQFDLLQNTASGTGLWAETARRGDFTPNPAYPTVDEIRPFTCFRNCALKETGMWAIKKLSSSVKAVLAMRACLQAIGGDIPSFDTCASLFTKKIAETVPGFSEVKAFTKCLSECVNPDTRQKHVCTGPLTTVELPTWTWFNPVSWTEGGRKRQYITYECNTATGMWTTASVLYCPPGFVAQKGADDGYGRPCVPANEDVAFAYGYDERKVPSASSLVTLNVAKDPNAKYGVYGATAAAVLPGQTLVYTITCENEGSGAAYSVYILDTLSPHLDATTLDLGGHGQYSAALGQVSWDIGDLAPKGSPGSTAEVTFTIKPRTPLTDGLEIANQAVVYFPSVPEVTPTNVVVNTLQAVAAIPQTVAAVAGQAQAIVLHGAGPGALTYAIDEAPHYGVLSGSPPTVSYTADRGYSGADYFTFRVTSGGQTSEPAEVSISVAPDPADPTPPTVLAVSPADAAQLPLPAPAAFTDTLGVGYYPLATFQFSAPLNPATVTAASVRLSAGGQPVNATVQYVAGLNQVILTPRQAMHQDTVYTLLVTTDVRDSSGHALAAPFTATFQLVAQASSVRSVYLPAVHK